ncbi:hypothetical protein CIB48_g2096 [Xylaria polymorpha]|nr:hypothetical protein CIB48_g2096 [Xylaria polymorpha]
MHFPASSAWGTALAYITLICHSHAFRNVIWHPDIPTDLGITTGITHVVIAFVDPIQFSTTAQPPSPLIMPVREVRTYFDHSTKVVTMEISIIHRVSVPSATRQDASIRHQVKAEDRPQSQQQHAARLFISSGITLSTTTTTVSGDLGGLANAFGIQIQYRYEDFISTSTTVSTSFSTTSIIQPTNSGSPDQNHRGGLSTGASIGIGVGVGFAALLLIGGFISAVCVRRRRAHKLNSPQEQDGNVAMHNNNTGDTHHANMEHLSAKELPLGLTNYPVAELEHPPAELGERH